MATGYALFDFDGTIISGDTLFYFCRYAHKNKLCTTKQLMNGLRAGIRFLMGRITDKESKEIALSFLIGKSEKEITEYAEQFCEEVLLKKQFSSIDAILKKHRDEGRKIILISASPQILLNPVLKRLGLNAIIATDIALDENGCYLGKMGDNCKGIQKPLRLAAYLSSVGDTMEYSDSYAYGDSESDFPMMKLCKYRIMVNPQKKLLKEQHNGEDAQVVHWKI